MQKDSESVVCVSVLGSVDTIHSYGYTEGLFLLTWYVALDYGFDWIVLSILNLPLCSHTDLIEL